MKRILSLLLSLLLLGSLAACQFGDSSEHLNPVAFYYPRNTADFVYGSTEGVIAPELREASGHEQDLHYLVSMYLTGPQDPNLRSPFPAGCTLRSLHEEDTTLHISLSSQFAALEGIELTLACVSITKTFLPLTTFQTICIDAASEERNIQIALDADSVLLADANFFEAPLPEAPPQ